MSSVHMVFIGVSGTGKRTIGTVVAAELGCDFAEGDDMHPQTNLDKMRGGTPLTDEDRRPWLRAVAAWTRARAAEGRSTAVTCSALRRSYRDVLRAGAPDTCFVHLSGSRVLLLDRMDGREHFMPATLLDSQLETLEPLQPDERGMVIDIDVPLDDLVEGLVTRLSR